MKRKMKRFYDNGAYHTFNSQEKKLRRKVNEIIESDISTVISKSCKFNGK